MKSKIIYLLPSLGILFAIAACSNGSKKNKSNSYNSDVSYTTSIHDTSVAISSETGTSIGASSDEKSSQTSSNSSQGQSSDKSSGGASSDNKSSGQGSSGDKSSGGKSSGDGSSGTQSSNKSSPGGYSDHSSGWSSGYFSSPGGYSNLSSGGYYASQFSYRYGEYDETPFYEETCLTLLNEYNQRVGIRYHVVLDRVDKDTPLSFYVYGGEINDVIIPSDGNNIVNDQGIIKVINNASNSVLFFTIFDDNPYQPYVFLEAYSK